MKAAGATVVVRGDPSVAIGGEVTVITTGDGNVVQQGRYNVQTGQAYRGRHR